MVSEAGFPAILADTEQSRVICDELFYEIEAGRVAMRCKKLWISVQNEEFLSKPVDFWDLSVATSTAWSDPRFILVPASVVHSSIAAQTIFSTFFEGTSRRMAHVCCGSVGFLPYMRMPTRQMRERSTWTPHSVASVSVIDRPICHQGGICTTILR